MSPYQMTPYELMVKTNHYLIKGGILSAGQSDGIVNRFLCARNTSQQAQRFYPGVRYPGGSKENSRRMYPIFYLPPCRGGKKFKTILGQMPGTQILSANMYELEILRLLQCMAPGNREVKYMVGETLERLKTTCFGYMEDGAGECFDTSLVVLRFIAAAAREDESWIQSRIDNYNRHCGDKRRPWFSRWYYWLCLSELPWEIVCGEIEKEKDEMRHWLADKGYAVNSDHDQAINPVRMCILRNALAKCPGYEYLKERQPYINPRDGRLYFDTQSLMETGEQLCFKNMR